MFGTLFVFGFMAVITILITQGLFVRLFVRNYRYHVMLQIREKTN